MATEPNNNQSSTPNGNDTGDSIQALTLRMLMQGKEAGSIIGKKGENVKKFREDSGAKINISDSSCPERIVTVTGYPEQIQQAFGMICKKFEDDMVTLQQLQAQIQGQPTTNLPKPIVAIRLIIPASQCGSLIGKGGAKIKDIRDSTGASIQVASDMLPNSTERSVTVTGTANAITQAIYHVCIVLLESPPKGATIPYRPKPAVPPVFYTPSGQAIALQPGQIISPADLRGGVVPYSATVSSCSQNGHQMKVPGLQIGGYPPGALVQIAHPGMMQGSSMDTMPGPYVHGGFQPIAFPAPLASPYGAPPPTGADPAYAQYKSVQQQQPAVNHLVQGQPQAGPRGPQLAPQNQAPGAGSQMHEMTIPNDLIGCIIGRGGSKINEIRQMSGAMIKISNAEETSGERKVTITGNADNINTAQYLINARPDMSQGYMAMNAIELHKQLNLVAAADQLVSLPPSSAAFLPPAQFLAPAAAMPPQAYPKPFLQPVLVSAPGCLPGVGGFPVAAAAAVSGMPIYTESRQDNLTTKVKVGQSLTAGDVNQVAHHPTSVGIHMPAPGGSMLGKDPKYSPY